MSTTRLVVLSTEIGRGHPSYLDSVLHALARISPAGTPPAEVRTIEQVCTGLSRLAWNAARGSYRLGGRGGIFTRGYNRLRGAGPPSASQRHALGHSLRSHFAGFDGICLVEHPLVAHILAPVCRTAYLHGEIAAPAGAAVPDAWRTFVPLESTREELVAKGTAADATVVTGLVIEPELQEQAESAVRKRLERLGSRRPLTVAFFTSGAYPRPHLESLYKGAGSVLAAGHRAVVFAGTNPERIERIGSRLSLSGIVRVCNPVRTGRAPLLDENDTPECVLVVSRSRVEETGNTARLFPHLDVMVAAAHERTNWTVGLGLPMFVLLPDIGPFAPLNHAFAARQGVCQDLAGTDEAASLGPRLTRLGTQDILTDMARNGFGRLPIDGASRTARHLLDRTG